MALVDEARAAMRNPGLLIINPTDIDGETVSDVGGTVPGRNEKIRLITKAEYQPIYFFEFGRNVAYHKNFEEWLLMGVNKNFDTDFIETANPENVVLGSATESGKPIIAAPAAVSEKFDIENDFVLLYRPHDPNNHPGVYFPRCVSHIPAERAINKALKLDYEHGFAFLAMPTSTDVAYVGMLEDIKKHLGL